MLNCKEASELMSRNMDVGLPFAKRLSLRFHLMMCHGCSNFLQQIQFLHKATHQWHLHDSETMPRLPNEAKKRISSVLHEIQSKNNSSNKNS